MKHCAFYEHITEEMIESGCADLWSYHDTIDAFLVS